MNERIKELIAEADRKCSETRGIYDEILAELIVQKCVDISDDYVKDCTCEEHIDCKHPRSAIGRKIREYLNA